MSSQSSIFANHAADAANEEAERESDYLLVSTQGRDLQEIEEALQRLDEGIYGACEACGSDIERRRLEVLPSARFCLRCQERQERLAHN
jgi:RNA polymerase-binding transcription factor DksA